MSIPLLKKENKNNDNYVTYFPVPKISSIIQKKMFYNKHIGTIMSNVHFMFNNKTEQQKLINVLQRNIIK